MPNAPRPVDAQLTWLGQEMVTKNIRLASWYVDKKLSPQVFRLFHDREEAINAATMGLVQAAIHWNKERASFATCAYVYMRNEVSRACAVQQGIRRPHHSWNCANGNAGDSIIKTAHVDPDFLDRGRRLRGNEDREEQDRETLDMRNEFLGAVDELDDQEMASIARLIVDNTPYDKIAAAKRCTMNRIRGIHCKIIRNMKQHFARRRLRLGK